MQATAGLETKAARRKWNPALHPRDSKGRFIETGGVVRLWGGKLARVVRALPRDRVLVQDQSGPNEFKGRRHTTSAKWVSMVARPDGSAPTDNERKVQAEDEKRRQAPGRGNGVVRDDDGEPDTPNDPHDADDQGRPIGEDEGDGPADDDEDEPADGRHPINVQALPDHSFSEGRFENLAAVRQHFLDLADQPARKPGMAEFLRFLASSDDLMVTGDGSLVIRQDESTKRWYLTATGTGERMTMAGDFDTADAARGFVRHLERTAPTEGSTEPLAPGFDFSDPNLDTAAQTWRSSAGENVQAAIRRAREEFDAGKPPMARQRPKAPARTETARPDPLRFDWARENLISLTMPAIVQEWVFDDDAWPTRDPDTVKARDTAKRNRSGSYKITAPLEVHEMLLEAAEVLSGAGADASAAERSAYNAYAKRVLEAVEKRRAQRRNQKPKPEQQAPAADVDVPETGGGDESTVSREDLRPGDRVSATVSGSDVEWPVSTRDQQKPDTVTVEGTVAATYRPGAGRTSVPLLDATLTGPDGTPIASNDTVDVLRMPSRVFRSATSLDALPEEVRADNVRVGDVIAQGQFGQVVTDVSRTRTHRTFTTRALGGLREIDQFGVPNGQKLHVVPKSRRRREDVVRDIAETSQQHPNSTYASRAAKNLLKAWGQADELAQRQWPDGAPEAYQALAKHMARVTGDPRGADGHDQNAQAMRSALVALHALDTENVAPELADALNSVETRLDANADRFAANARAIREKKRKKGEDRADGVDGETAPDGPVPGSSTDEDSGDGQRAPESGAADAPAPNGEAEQASERVTLTPDEVNEPTAAVRNAKAPSSMEDAELRDEIVALVEREMAEGELPGVDRTRMRVLEAEEARRAGRAPKEEKPKPKDAAADPDGLFGIEQPQQVQLVPDPDNPLDRPDDEFGTPDMFAAAEGRDTSKLRPVQTRKPLDFQAGDRFVDAEGRAHTVREQPLRTSRGRVRVVSEGGKEHFLSPDEELRVLRPDEEAPAAPTGDTREETAAGGSGPSAEGTAGQDPAEESRDTAAQEDQAEPEGAEEDGGALEEGGAPAAAPVPPQTGAARPLEEREPQDLNEDELAIEIERLENVTGALETATDPLALAYRLRAERRLWALRREEGDRWQPTPQYDKDGNLVEPTRGEILLDRVAGYRLNQDEGRGAVSSVDELPPAKPRGYSDADWASVEAVAAAGEEYPPTDEQRVIIEGAARRGLDMRVMALAGTGKSTTLKMLSRRMPGKKILYLAFNRSVANEAIEAQQRGEYASNLTPTTANAYANSMVDRDLLDRLKWPRLNDQQIADRMRWRDNVPAGSDTLSPRRAAHLANRLLEQWAKSDDADFAVHHLPDGISNRDAVFQAVKPLAERMWANLTDPKARTKEFDLPLSFDHTVKMWALSGRVPDADVLFWDEAQDVNPVMEGIVRNVRAAGIQVVAVGDSNQAIYGFRGATDALGRLPADATATLTQTFRFGDEVADAGNRFLLLLGSRMRLKGWDRKNSRREQIIPGDETMLIARTNAGAVLGAVEGLKAGRKVAVAGGLQDLQKFLEAAETLQRGERTSHQDLARFNGMSWDDIREEVAADRSLKQLDSMFKLMEKHSAELDALLDSARMPRPLIEDDGEHIWVKFSFGDRNFDATKEWLKHKDQGFGWDPATKRWGYPPPRGKKRTSDQERAAVMQKVQRYIDTWYTAPETASGGQIVDQAAPHDLLVSTAHKAKGLESERVRIADDWRGPKETPEGNIDWDTIPEDEELRLAYVALTRATDVLDASSLGWVFDVTQEPDPLEEPDGQYTRDWKLTDFRAGSDVSFWSEDGESVIRGTVETVGDYDLMVRTPEGRTDQITAAQVTRLDGKGKPRLPVASPEELDAAMADGRFAPPQEGNGAVRLPQAEVRETLQSIRPAAVDDGQEGAAPQPDTTPPAPRLPGDEDGAARVLRERLPALPKLPKLSGLGAQDKNAVRRIRSDYEEVVQSLDGILAGDPPTGDAREDLRRVRQSLDYIAQRLTRDLLPDSEEAQTVRTQLLELGEDLERALAEFPDREPEPQGDGPNGGTLFRPWDLQDGDLVRFDAVSPAYRAGGLGPYFGHFRGASSASGGRTLVTYQGRSWNDDRQQWEPDISQHTVVMPSRGLVERFTEEQWDAWRRPGQSTAQHSAPEAPKAPPAPIREARPADMSDEEINAELEELQAWQDRHVSPTGEGPRVEGRVWFALQPVASRRGELGEEQRLREVARRNAERKEKEKQEKEAALARVVYGTRQADGSYPVSVDGRQAGSIRRLGREWEWVNSDGDRDPDFHRSRDEAAFALVRNVDMRAQKQERRTPPAGWVLGDRATVAENDVIRVPVSSILSLGWRDPVRVRRATHNSNGTLVMAVENLDGSRSALSPVFLSHPDDVFAREETPATNDDDRAARARAVFGEGMNVVGGESLPEMQELEERLGRAEPSDDREAELRDVADRMEALAEQYELAGPQGERAADLFRRAARIARGEEDQEQQNTGNESAGARDSEEGDEENRRSRRDNESDVPGPDGVGSGGGTPSPAPDEVGGEGRDGAERSETERRGGRRGRRDQDGSGNGGPDVQGLDFPEPDGSEAAGADGADGAAGPAAAATPASPRYADVDSLRAAWRTGEDLAPQDDTPERRAYLADMAGRDGLTLSPGGSIATFLQPRGDGGNHWKFAQSLNGTNLPGITLDTDDPEEARELAGRIEAIADRNGDLFDWNRPWGAASISAWRDGEGRTLPQALRAVRDDYERERAGGFELPEDLTTLSTQVLEDAFRQGLSSEDMRRVGEEMDRRDGFVDARVRQAVPEAPPATTAEAEAEGRAMDEALKFGDTDITRPAEPTAGRLRREWEALDEERWLAAMEATGGRMLSPGAEADGVDPRAVFSGWKYTNARAFELSSQELQRWVKGDKDEGVPANGRLTYAQYRQREADRVLRAEFALYDQTRYEAAVEATNGFFFAREHKFKAVPFDERELFSGGSLAANDRWRRYASEDLQEWFDANGGRRTFAQFKKARRDDDRIAREQYEEEQRNASATPAAADSDPADSVDGSAQQPGAEGAVPAPERAADRDRVQEALDRLEWRTTHQSEEAWLDGQYLGWVRNINRDRPDRTPRWQSTPFWTLGVDGMVSSEDRDEVVRALVDRALRVGPMDPRNPSEDLWLMARVHVSSTPSKQREIPDLPAAVKKKPGAQARYERLLTRLEALNARTLTSGDLRQDLAQARDDLEWLHGVLPQTRQGGDQQMALNGLKQRAFWASRIIDALGTPESDRERLGRWNDPDFSESAPSPSPESADVPERAPESARGAAARPEPEAVPDPIGGQPAHWARVENLVPGDMVRMTGTTRQGRKVQRVGYVSGNGPVLVDVTSRGRTEKRWRTRVTEHPDGTGEAGNVFVSENASVARAAASDDAGPSSLVNGAQSSLRAGGVPDRLPADNSGQVLYPGSNVTSSNGREGTVTGATDTAVSVAWDDSRDEDTVSPTSVTVTDSQRPDGWTADGRRVTEQSVVSDTDGRLLGPVDRVDGDDVTITTADGTVTRSAGDLQVAGEVRDDVSVAAPVSEIDEPTSADLNDGDVVLLDLDGALVPVKISGTPQRNGDRVTLQYVDTVTGETGEIDVDSRAVLPRALGAGNTVPDLGPDDMPEPDEELTVHAASSAVEPVTGPTVDPELTRRDRDIVGDHADALDDAPEAQQAAARIERDLPVTAGQASALAEQLRAAADPSGEEGRAALRAADRLDSAAGRTPETAPARPRPSTAAQVGEGDTVALADGENGQVRPFHVAGVEEGPGGVRRLVLEDEQQQRQTRVVAGGLPVWMLPPAQPRPVTPPDPNDPAPAPPAPEVPVAQVRPGDLRIGDLIDAPVNRAGYQLNGHRRLTIIREVQRSGWWTYLTGVDENGNVHDVGLHSGRTVNVYDRSRPTPALPQAGAPRDPNPAPQTDVDRLVGEHVRSMAARIIQEAIAGTEPPGDVHALREQIGQRLTAEALRDARQEVRRDGNAALDALGLSDPELADTKRRLHEARRDAHKATVRAALRTINDLEPLPDESNEDLAARARDLLRLIPAQVANRPANTSRTDPEINRAVTGHVNGAVNALLRELLAAGIDPGDATQVAALLAQQLAGTRRGTARRIASRAGGRTAGRQPGLLAQVVALLIRMAKRLVELVKTAARAIAEKYRGARERLARLRAFLGRMARRVRQWPESRRLARLRALELPDATGEALSERVTHWASLMPAPGRFGQTQQRVTFWRPTTWDRLAAGRLPGMSDRIEWAPDRAADGGPGLTALRHLAALRAAGSDVDQDVTRRLAAALGDDFGDSPHETLQHADDYVAASERRLVNLRAARSSATIPDDQDLEIEITAARAELMAARREYEDLRGRYATAVPDAVAAALADIRDVGPQGADAFVFGPDTEPDAERAVRGVQRLVPRSWLSSTGARRLTAVNGTQGRYEAEGQRVTVVDLADEGLGTASHALAQHFAQHLEDLDAAQRAFWFTRTHTGRPGARRRQPSALDRLLQRQQQTQPETGDILARSMQAMFSGDWYQNDDLRAFLLGLLATR
ncbi:AAA family ATPase [Streptomyces sp. R302]|uniref:UvrD-helicase domain-containing protein n=1 Tax=unclassified Streptomyces TaxID=2593676 RepID=UPI00145E7FED|nr:MULTISPECIES: UvrD-helicase domain-containing protein [unclassified Streptomyces]NML55162.1 AAA family ATPase [Streptomyces sp. R301]NML83808.1 AAA family ATPase [Streptomyces sp. R302]